MTGHDRRPPDLEHDMVANVNLIQREQRKPGSRSPLPVPVWDARLSRFREVTLDDRSDPLWSAARALAALRARMSLAP